MEAFFIGTTFLFSEKGEIRSNIDYGGIFLRLSIFFCRLKVGVFFVMSNGWANGYRIYYLIMHNFLAFFVHYKKMCIIRKYRIFKEFYYVKHNSGNQFHSVPHHLTNSFLDECTLQDIQALQNH
jgi:hypothetical protein